jgi:hypothetical protein
VPLAGCRTLTAANLDGTRFVAFDTRTRTVTAPLIDGTEATVEIEHACLEAYLLAKLYSTRHRGYEKDYYDLVYVLLTSPDGPSGAARALADWAHTPSPAGLTTLLAEIEAASPPMMRPVPRIRRTEPPCRSRRRRPCPTVRRTCGHRRVHQRSARRTDVVSKSPHGTALNRTAARA